MFAFGSYHGTLATKVSKAVFPIDLQWKGSLRPLNQILGSQFAILEGHKKTFLLWLKNVTIAFGVNL